MPSKRPAAHIASVRGKAAGIKWERESSVPEVDAGTAEDDRTSGSVAYRPDLATRCFGCRAEKRNNGWNLETLVLAQTKRSASAVLFFFQYYFLLKNMFYQSLDGYRCFLKIFYKKCEHYPAHDMMLISSIWNCWKRVKFFPCFFTVRSLLGRSHQLVLNRKNIKTL